MNVNHPAEAVPSAADVPKAMTVTQAALPTKATLQMQLQPMQLANAMHALCYVMPCMTHHICTDRWQMA